MNRWYLALATLTLVIFEAGCSSALPPAPDTRAADEKAIQAVEAAWLQDIVSRDVEKSISHYTDDASFLLADMPIQTGKDAIRATYQQMLADPNMAVEFSSSKIEVAKNGDFAYSQGVYTMTETDPKTKRPVTETGKYLTVFKKQSDGSWKAVEDMLNENARPTPVARKAKASPKHSTPAKRLPATANH
jgi:uncharacterized protein (TIGR02246 family)